MLTMPMVLVLPRTTEQVVQMLRYCSAHGVKVVPQGAGTSLSGGALPLEDRVLLGLGEFKRILGVDIPNRCVVVQFGVTNLGITHAVQDQGFYYAPDPGSQIACTIGGNENRHIFSTLARLRPNTRAASRRLWPSRNTKRRTAA